MPAKKTPRKKTEPKASRPHMPGYGLPKGRKGLLPWKWALERLQNSHNYWIATTRADSSPHVMVQHRTAITQGTQLGGQSQVRHLH